MSMAMKMVRRRGAATVWRRACVRASRRIVSCGRVGVARFEYDAIGRIVSRGHALGTNTFDRAYTYDDFDRLAADGDVTYAYDAAGNRLSKTDAGGPVAYTLGMGDRLASWTGGSYSHDTAGCVTRIVRGGDALNLSWNGQYQLVSVATNGAFAESYAYDALGRRVSTTTLEGTIRHVYDGVQCIADLNADGEVVVSYTWGAGIDNLLAIHTGGATYYPLTDVQGTVWGYVDSSNSIVARFEYDAWGNILSATSSVPALARNRYRFQGREWSAATGLVNFRARWYDPVTGRWLSKDPIGLSGGLNLYAFCGNDPLNSLDPYGESPSWSDVYHCVLDDEYGDVLTISDALGLFGIGNMLYNGASSIYNSVVASLAENQITQAELSGALNNGNIVSKILAADKGAKVAASTKALGATLSKVGNVGAAVTVGATGFSVGARLYAAGVATATVLGFK